MNLTVTIPGKIDPALSPNHRAHTHWPRTRAIADARNYTTFCVMQALMAAKPTRLDIPDALTYHIEYGIPKGGRRRDDDNLIACTKAHRDAITESLGLVDDRGWTLGTVTQQRDPDGIGYLAITLEWEHAKEHVA